MTAESVSQNWLLPSFRLTSYQTSVCLSTQIHSSRFPKQCENTWMLYALDASESSKMQKETQGNSLFPLDVFSQAPGQFIITQDSHFTLDPSSPHLITDVTPKHLSLFPPSLPLSPLP